MSKLYVVGIGPGNYEDMTLRAIRTLEASDIIIGYTVYIELVKEHFPGKDFLSTPMTQEVKRCALAFEQAESGKTVSMICSGDAGIYGMAGLIADMGGKHPKIQIEVVPGVTAAASGAAVLGAPLIHDFAVISLSDLLTPWETIAGRIRGAAKADFCICLYNPSSKKRHDYLQKACDMLLEYRKEDTICGYVANIRREGEVHTVCTLAVLRDTSVDMFTTVFIGNSQTKELGGRMITPRGYENG